MSKPSQFRPRELAAFFVITYAISWVLWLPLVLGQSGLGVLSNRLPVMYVSVGTIGPAAAALMVRRRWDGDWRAFRLWTGWQSVFTGLLAGCAIVLLACFTAAAWMTESGFRLWNWPALLRIPLMFVPNLIGGPLGEEPGWRGFAQPRLQTRFSPVLSSLIVGLLWANWHLPLFIVHFVSIPYWWYAPFLMSASVIMTFGLNLSKGSVIVAIVMHGIFNVGLGVILNDFVGKAAIRRVPARARF